jgi:hypothetical protein
MSSTHDSDHLRGQLEGGTLEAHTTGGNVKAETEINVDDMAGVVDHDISVVSVLELQKVGDNRVGSHTLDEVGAGFLEPD